MNLALNVAILMTVGFLEGAGVLSIEIDDENAVIEIFNNCKCVPDYECDENGNIISYDPSRLIKPRINTPMSRIECKSNSSKEYYCCKSNKVYSGSPLRAPSADSLRTYVRDSPKVKCGVGQTLMVLRILSDDDDEASSLDGEFPWMAAVFKKTRSGKYKFVCGGSLIHPKVVLTANHCIYKKSSNNLLVVVNGKTNRPLPEETEGKRHVSEVIRHPNYAHMGKLHYDAALLILEKPFLVEEDSDVRTLCLPPNDVNMEDIKCLVIGWGKDNDSRRSKQLRKVEVPFISHSKCDALLKNTRLGRGFDLHESSMCAGGEEERDACVGDGGGPLMCPMPSKDNQYFQAGIVSWGLGCGLKNVPGVYADVGKITQWIKKELGDRHLDV